MRSSKYLIHRVLLRLVLVGGLQGPILREEGRRNWEGGRGWDSRKGRSEAGIDSITVLRRRALGYCCTPQSGMAREEERAEEQ